jgi:hypothetical protein
MRLIAVSALVASTGAQHTVSDDKLSATFGTGADFGALIDLKLPGAASVIGDAKPGSLWSASFVGTGIGAQSISSATAKCTGTEVTADDINNSLSFKWVDCIVDVPAPPPPPAPGPPPAATYVLHNQSNCAGTCMPKHSSGPKGGACNRLPGCGHDAGLPYCDVAAMEARCTNATGCVAFNTNGYLYSNSPAVTPFHAYPLECWTRSGAPTPTVGVPVNVTVDVALADGLLEFYIAFDAGGGLSLWDYTLAVTNLRTGTPTSKAVSTNAASQLVGAYDTALPTGNAVYFAAHDPAAVVKTCGGGGGAMHCTVDALDATLPLRHYRAAFPIAATVITGDWWDIASVYRKWVVPNANWMQLGPLDARTDMPDWLENVTLWMNNNWGGDPLVPTYGGDPEYVKNEMLKVNRVLALPEHGGHLALHWWVESRWIESRWIESLALHGGQLRVGLRVRGCAYQPLPTSASLALPQHQHQGTNGTRSATPSAPTTPSAPPRPAPPAASTQTTRTTFRRAPAAGRA